MELNRVPATDATARSVYFIAFILIKGLQRDYSHTNGPKPPQRSCLIPFRQNVNKTEGHPFPRRVIMSHRPSRDARRHFSGGKARLSERSFGNSRGRREDIIVTSVSSAPFLFASRTPN